MNIFLFDIRSGVLTPEMRDALWGNPASDAWYFFSGTRHCKKCLCDVLIPHGLIAPTIPKHNCIERKPTYTEMGNQRELGLPPVEPVHTEAAADVLNSLFHKGVTKNEIETARPLLKTLLEEMQVP